MGKKLVIKGADFSENGIKGVSFLSHIPLVIGYQWASTLNSTISPLLTSTTNNARASQTEYVDISNIVSAYPTIKLKAKAGYKFAVYFGTTNEPDTDHANIVGWSYIASGNTLELDISSCLYAIIMVASNDDSELVSTDWEAYIEEL